MARIIRKTSPSAQQETKKTVDTTKEESVEAIETEIERLENLPKTDDTVSTSLVSGKAYFGKLGYQKIPKNLESLNKQTTRFGNNKQPPKHILDLIK